MSSLAAFSDQLADAVSAAAASVVAVHARPRLASTGVHWRDGVIVTTDATVKRTDDIAVTMPDGTRVTATLAGRDAGTDLAALRIPTGLLPVAPRAAAADLRPGHLVLALARTGGDGHHATAGVVSSVGEAWRTWRGGTLDRRIQSDIELFPGFGGGPLVTASGGVAGINSGGMSKPLCVTIPDTTIDRILDAVLNRGYVARGWLGASMQSVRFSDSATAKLGFDGRGGLVVLDVEHDSPAAHGGVMIGDVLVRIDEVRIAQHDDVLAFLGSDRVGTTVQLQVVRGGEVVILPVTIGERPRTAR
ncbi:MAG: trypsin-like peptidase domain-containing protein [Gemmatimonadaceae bacterium]|nr:trypsin-like peptidase domain-containing protein [Gemmatimonadaceae bacterium]